MSESEVIPQTTETPEKATKRKSREKKSTEDAPLRKSPRIASRESPAASSSEPKSTKGKSPKVEAAEKSSPAKRSRRRKTSEVEEKRVMEETTETTEPEKTESTEPEKTKATEQETTETSKDESVEMSESEWENAKSVLDFTVRDLKGEEVSLEKFKGYVLLIVNVASKCGLTSSNYGQLVQLDEKFREKGLRILAFPCNQFGHQEPGSADDICEFIKKKNVNFDIFEKIEVNGKNAHPLYKYLKKQQPGTFGDFIKWNFTKFIVDKEGKPVERHPPTASPESLIPNIEKYL